MGWAGGFQQCIGVIGFASLNWSRIVETSWCSIFLNCDAHFEQLACGCSVWHFQWHTSELCYWISVSLSSSGPMNIDDLLKKNIECEKEADHTLCNFGNLHSLSNKIHIPCFEKKNVFAQVSGLKCRLRFESCHSLLLSHVWEQAAAYGSHHHYAQGPVNHTMTDCCGERAFLHTLHNMPCSGFLQSSHLTGTDSLWSVHCFKPAELGHVWW